MKYSRRLFVAIAALAGMAPAQALAQDMNGNIRCLIVSNLFAKSSKEAKAKEIAGSAMLFYGGRVSNLSNAQIETGLLAQRKQVTAENAAKTMNECAQAMNRAVQKIEAAGQKVKAPAGR